MKKRLVSVALVAALAAGTLAGCGSSSSGDNTQAAAGGETAGKGGIIFWGIYKVSYQILF